jgi:predicted ATPase
MEKLEAVLRRAAPPDEDLGLLADLLSLPGSERHGLPTLSPPRKKQRTLEALIRQLDGMARQQPVVVVFEDAHWIDPTSRELLDLAVEWVREPAAGSSRSPGSRAVIGSNGQHADAQPAGLPRSDRPVNDRWR